MTAPADERQALAHVVDDALVAVGRLKRILERERRALIDQDPDAVDSAAADKHAAAVDLETLEARRQALCSTLLGTPTPAGSDLAPLLADATLWPRFCAALRGCHELNAANGRLLTQRRHHVRQALNVLCGGGEPLDAGTYGPRADTHSPLPSHTLGSA